METQKIPPRPNQWKAKKVKIEFTVEDEETTVLEIVVFQDQERGVYRRRVFDIETGDESLIREEINYLDPRSTTLRGLEDAKSYLDDFLRTDLTERQYYERHPQQYKPKP